VAFSHDEIDKVVVAMPSDRAPRQDKFAGLFLKISWPIIKHDLYVGDMPKRQ
jgi:hypothetical protein